VTAADEDTVPSDSMSSAVLSTAPGSDAALTPTAAFSISMRIVLRNEPGTLGRFAMVVGDAGGNIATLSEITAKGPSVGCQVDIHAADEAHARRIVAAVDAAEGVDIEEWWDRTYRLHEGGKIEVLPLCSVGDAHDLAMAYTPGVARICRSIHEDPSLAHAYTVKKNTVAIVTDGSAVLGLGDIGPAAALPVMEGKALLFKEFAGVDAYPICLDTATPDEVVETVRRIAPVFGGINLEDIAAPACFEIEDRLRAALDIPVFHDDQHGTAVVVLAALENALRIVGKAMSEVSVVISGMGAAGVATARILHGAGAGEIVGADRMGAIHEGRDGLNPTKQRLAEFTNPDRKAGSVSELLRGADVFVGVSAPDLLKPADVARMADAPIVFALANPDPEIRPEAIADLAAVVATGRSDYPNQINNVLAFPGIFRGALDVCARAITEPMKLAAADAIAGCCAGELSPQWVVPSVFDPKVAPAVAAAVAEAAEREGIARTDVADNHAAGADLSRGGRSA